MAEAEKLLEQPQADERGSLADHIGMAWCTLFDAYIKACDDEDWYSALAMHQCFKDLDIIYEYEPDEELTSNLKDWCTKAENPSELYVCY